MEKLIERFNTANNLVGVTSGLLAAQTICRRACIEAESDEARLLVCKIMEDVVQLMETVKSQIPEQI
jgi:hypothetical protein